MAKAKQAKNTVYQLKVTLQDSKPPIWRRLLVPGQFTLEEVHAVIQVCLGWENAHLHQFLLGDHDNAVWLSHLSFELGSSTIRDRKAIDQKLADLGFDTTRLSPKQLDQSNVLDEADFRLHEVVSREGATLLYEYDFGDSWEHEILVEKITAPEPDIKYPTCIDGARNSPPEDCGGIDGYADLLDALSDPKRDDHQEALDWVGDDFDPEHFDLDEINEDMAFYEDWLIPPDNEMDFDDEEDEPSDEEIEEALGMLTEQIKAFVQEVVPATDGFALRFPGGIPLVNVVVPQFVTVTFAQFPHLKVVFELGPGSEAVWVRIAGPAEDLEAVKATLGIK
jgi:hypothetical protein